MNDTLLATKEMRFTVNLFGGVKYKCVWRFGSASAQDAGWRGSQTGVDRRGVGVEAGIGLTLEARNVTLLKHNTTFALAMEKWWKYKKWYIKRNQSKSRSKLWKNKHQS